VMLTVTTDASGVARRAEVASQDAGRVAGDIRLRVFSERAVRAVLDPHCANLPLPQTMLGKTNVLTFRFSP
jgi:neural Wiskott-Aldrich syndrome protein